MHEIQVSSSNMVFETRIDELTSLVRQLAVGETQTKRLCGMHTSPKHPTNTWPTLLEGIIMDLDQAYATNISNPHRNNQYRYNTPDLIISINN